MTNTTENITFLQTTYAGFNKRTEQHLHDHISHHQTVSNAVSLLQNYQRF